MSAKPSKAMLKFHVALGPEILGGLLGCPHTHISSQTGNWLFGDGSQGPYSRDEVISMLEDIGFTIWDSERKLPWTSGLVVIPPKVTK